MALIAILSGIVADIGLLLLFFRKARPAVWLKAALSPLCALLGTAARGLTLFSAVGSLRDVAAAFTGARFMLLYLLAGVPVSFACGAAARFIYNRFFDRDAPPYLFGNGRRGLFSVDAAFYCALVFCVLTASVFAADRAMRYDDWFDEDAKIYEMLHERQSAMNDRDYPLVRGAGEAQEAGGDAIRILVVGDSFVYGEGSPDINCLWWKQMSEKLRQRGYNVRVDAVGIGGASTYDEMRWITDTSLLRDLSPDLIVVGLVSNDADLSGFRDFPDYYGFFFSRFGTPFSDFLKKKLPNVTAVLDYRLTARVSKTENRFNNADVGYEYAMWEKIMLRRAYLDLYRDRVLAPLYAAVGEAGIPTVFMTTPSAPDSDYCRTWFGTVVPEIKKAGFPVFDCTEAFCAQLSQRKYRKNCLINPVNTHPGTACTAFFGAFAADMLEKNYAAVLGAGGESPDGALRVNDWMPYALDVREVSSDGSGAVYTFLYPAAGDGEHFLSMPCGEDYVRLNIETPICVDEILISGSSVEQASLYLTGIGPLGYDTQKLTSCGKKDGPECRYAPPADFPVTSLCVHLDLSGGQAASVTVAIRRKGGQ